MENQDYSKILDQIQKLMQELYRKTDVPVSPEIELLYLNQIRELEKQVEKFQKKGDELVRSFGLSDYAIEEILKEQGVDLFTPEQQELLKRAETLKKEAQTAATDPKKAEMEALRQGQEKKKKDAEQLSVQKRKSKFKRSGGSEKWKKL